MSRRRPAAARVSAPRAVLILAVALLGAAGLVLPGTAAAALPSVPPPTVLHLTVSAAEVRYGETVEVAAWATIPDGTPADGTIEVRLDGATGSAALMSGRVLGAKQVRTTLTPAPGRVALTARFAPTRAIDQTSASATATLHSRASAELTLRLPARPLAAGRSATVRAQVTTSAAAPAPAGMVVLEWDSTPSFATCELRAFSTTSGECLLALPATIAPGPHTVNAVWTGDDRFADAVSTQTVTVAATGGSDSGAAAPTGAGTATSGAAPSGTAPPGTTGSAGTGPEATEAEPAAASPTSPPPSAAAPAPAVPVATTGPAHTPLGAALIGVGVLLGVGMLLALTVLAVLGRRRLEQRP